jgi:hypothetical protein
MGPLMDEWEGLMKLYLAIAIAVPVLAGCKQSSEPAEATPGKPPLAEADVPRSIFRAQYELEAGLVKAGTLFALQLDPQGPVLGITAHHIFGTMGGLRRDLAPDELVRTFQKGEIQHISSGITVAPLGKPLLLPEAKRFTNDLLSPDVAAFTIASPGSILPLKVAAARPKAGEIVWLVAATLGPKKDGSLQHPARVVLSDDDAVVFEYFDPSIELRATSGAPILSGKGEVVGINLSGGKKEAKLVGMAGSIPNVRKQIIAALH